MIDKIHHFLSEHKIGLNDLLEGGIYGTLTSVFVQSLEKEIVHMFWVLTSAVGGAVVVYFTKKLLRKFFPDNQKEL